jgi:hypothetical protein
MKHLIALLLVVFLCFGSTAALAQGKPTTRPTLPSKPTVPVAPTLPQTPKVPETPATGKASGRADARANADLEHGKSADEILAANTKLSGKVQTLVNQDARAACSGFKNLGECVAAAHVSSNLGISFNDLKAKVTGESSMSLGAAVHALNPSVDSKAEVRKAKLQAKADLKVKD